MVKTPGSYIREELKRRGWSQTEFAQIIDRPIQTVNEIVQGKKAITPDTAALLGVALGPDAVTWLNREAEYRLSKLDSDATAVARRVRLYDMAPIRDMEKRGWIKPTGNIHALEAELMRFFGVESLDEEPKIGAVTRRSSDQEPISQSQRAWCFRVRQMAASLCVPPYDESRLDSCKKALRKLAAYPQETHKVPQVLASHGIRFVIVEPLPGTKVDGVAMWIGDSPAIGLSCRYDRFDSFWFTLGHEITHIENHDEAPLDSDLAAATPADDIESLQSVKPPMERRADEGAAAMLIPPPELDSFIRRVGPLYAKQRIVQFANRIKIHPAIVVGQLQNRGEIGFHANREMLSKVKHFVLPTSITDGWGYTLDQRSVE